MSRSCIRPRITRWLIACTFVVCIAKLAHGEDVHVRGHYRQGQWIAPHYRSEPDGNFGNNWSTKPNRNPYTGELGTRVTPPAGYSGRWGGSLPLRESPLPGNTSLHSNGYSSVVPGYGRPDALTQWRTTPPRFAPAARWQPGAAPSPLPIVPALSPPPEQSLLTDEEQILRDLGIVSRPVTEREALDWGAPNGRVIENPFVKP